MITHDVNCLVRRCVFLIRNNTHTDDRNTILSTPFNHSLPMDEPPKRFQLKRLIPRSRLDNNSSAQSSMPPHVTTVCNATVLQLLLVPNDH